MKKILKTSILAAGLITPAMAQVTWDNGGTDTLLTNAQNWTTDTAPTGGTTGTYDGTDGTNPVNATLGSTNLSGYDITQTGGNVSASGTNTFNVGTGSYRLNGSSASVSGFRNFNVSAGGTLTIDQGSLSTLANGGAADSDVLGTMVMNGGTLNTGRRLSPRSGGTITVNDGTVTGTGELGGSNLDSGDIFLNGGDLDFISYSAGGNAIDLFFGGTTAGNLSIENFSGFRHQPNNIDIDFASGSLMSMTLTNPVESGGSGDARIGWWNVGDETGAHWAEALWSNGRLTYDGDDFTTLGAWSTVNGTIFDWDGTTNTLALVPEPSTAVLLFGGLAGLALLRRKRP
jgi:hypothetical protein